MTERITRLTLLCHAATGASRRAAFPQDEPLDEKARQAAERLAWDLPRADRVWSGPSRSAGQTAAALGVVPEVAEELDDWDVRAWRGRTVEELERADPEGLAAWRQDPLARPHGGESLQDLLGRVGRWVDGRFEDCARVLAVTHASVIRAALVHALDAPPSTFWSFDVAPLTRTVLHTRGDRWIVREVNVP
ncbi:MAG TPA: histidine phosphatase family protein [Candidatus Binatia bacterium]|nr:histidine phosphatase family protein [Candidatus Binatia bacterium]